MKLQLRNRRIRLYFCWKILSLNEDSCNFIESDWTKQRIQWITINITYEFSGLIKEWNFLTTSVTIKKQKQKKTVGFNYVA